MVKLTEFQEDNQVCYLPPLEHGMEVLRGVEYSLVCYMQGSTYDSQHVLSYQMIQPTLQAIMNIMKINADFCNTVDFLLF